MQRRSISQSILQLLISFARFLSNILRCDMVVSYWSIDGRLFQLEFYHSKFFSIISRSQNSILSSLSREDKMLSSRWLSWRSLDLILNIVARLFNRTLRINVCICIALYNYIYRDENEHVRSRCLYVCVYTFILKYLLSEAGRGGVVDLGAGDRIRAG